MRLIFILLVISLFSCSVEETTTFPVELFSTGEISGNNGLIMNLDRDNLQLVYETKPDTVLIMNEKLLLQEDNIVPYETSDGATGESKYLVYSDSAWTITLFEDEVYGYNQVSKMSLGSLREDIYAANFDPIDSFSCGTVDTITTTEFIQETASLITAQSNKVVKTYFELEYDFFQAMGSTEKSVQFMTSIMNVVKTLYKNDGMNVATSKIFVWTSQDPYPNTSTLDALVAFRTQRTTFDGNLAHLVSLVSRPSGGIAYVRVINSSHAYAYSQISKSFSEFPKYSWTVNVITHEMGHQIGSPHTHSCSWPGGAIDNCFNPEGNCSSGPAPTNGGTIMSYCHLRSYGINPQNGFGPQPSQLLRNIISSTNGLDVEGEDLCKNGKQDPGETKVDCGGNCPPCDVTGITYCNSSSKSGSFEWISKVSVGSIDNSSGSSKYTDFTSVSTDLIIGKEVQITLTPAFRNKAYEEGWSVWIDLDKDGKFATGEQVLSATKRTSFSSIISTISIPASAPVGVTRMRIGMSFKNPLSNPCSVNNFYGEVEDYTVHLKTGTTQPCSNPTLTTIFSGSTLQVNTNGSKVVFTQNGQRTEDTQAPFAYSVTCTGTISVEAHNNCGKASKALQATINVN